MLAEGCDVRVVVRPEILALSHRIVVMSQGRVTGTLTANEADQETIMKLATQNIEEVAA